MVKPVQEGFKLAKKRKKDETKLLKILDLLAREKPIPKKYRDHPLQGNWRGYRELHIEPDWLLIYRCTEEAVFLARTGTHADLFR